MVVCEWVLVRKKSIYYSTLDFTLDHTLDYTLDHNLDYTLDHI